MTIDNGIFPRIKEHQKTTDGVEIERFLVLHAGCTLTPLTLEKGTTDADGYAIFTMAQECSIHGVRSASFETRWLVELRSV